VNRTNHRYLSNTLAATADAATRTAKNNYLVAYTETAESWNPIVEVVLDVNQQFSISIRYFASNILWTKVRKT
jgi:hypothetical protein